MKIKAVSEALKFFNRLSIEDLVDNFDLDQLRKIRTLILKEVKGKTKIEGKPVVSGKDIGKINKAIKRWEEGGLDHLIEEQAEAAAHARSLRRPRTVSPGGGKGSKVKATTKRNQKDWEKLFESDTFSGSNLETNILRGHDPDAKAAFKAWKTAKGKSSGTLTDTLERAGPKIEPASPSTSVEVIKKPRRRTTRKSPKIKSSSEQNMRNEAKNAFNKAIKEGRLTERTADDYMFMGKNKQGRDLFKHRDTRNYIKNKGGMIKRPQMMHGGSHKGKKHAYAAGGSVEEMKLFK